MKRLAAFVLLAFATPAWAQPVQITLPELLAVELPPGATALAPTDAPLRDLLAAATAGGRRVTADVAAPLPAGPAPVIWTAWDANGKPAATRSAVIIVLPAGSTPVGTSGDENATGGNNASRIVRDATGHVHMMWADSAGPSGRTGPVYRRARVEADGSVRLETPPLYVAEGSPADWNCYPALALADDAVQLIWQGGGTVRTRRLSPGFVLGPVIDTGDRSDGRDVGPAIAAGFGQLHLVTPSAVYAVSADDGRSWQAQALPVPAGQRVKTASIAAREDGAVDIAFSSVVRDPKPANPEQGGGGYWQLRTIRRGADGAWGDARDVLAGLPAWGAPTAADEDALVDWVRIAAGAHGTLHAVWHGTGTSRIFGHDEAFYALRDAAGAWSPPVRLVERDAGHEEAFSFAPSLAVDGDRALALAFYNVDGGADFLGFDSAIAVLRGGRFEGKLIPVTHFVQDAVTAGHPDRAISVRFPAVAPTVWRAPDGHVWLDVLETLRPRIPGAVGDLIVYQRVDVTAALSR